MSEKQNIEELFKSKLENFESPVNDAMWANISNSIGASTATSAASSASLLGRVFSTTGVAVTTGLVCTLITFLVMSSSENVENKTSTETNTAHSNETIVIETTKETTKESAKSDDEIAVLNITNQPEEVSDPSINQDKKETFVVKPLVTELEEEDYTKEPSYVHSFLTPKNETKVDTEANIKSEEKEKPSSSITIVETKENEIVATIIASPVGGYAPLDVYFSASTENGSVRWDFGDGNISDEYNPSHTFDTYGSYTVELLVTDEAGNEKRDYRIIEVEANSAITDIPNVFTPNGDGLNDLYAVKGKNLDSYQLKVFNRSGGVIFTSSSIDDKWDGKNKFGDNVPEGSYFYLIIAKGIDGKVYEHTGSITLSR